jgi:hypothetical protein
LTLVNCTFQYLALGSGAALYSRPAALHHPWAASRQRAAGVQGRARQACRAAHVRRACVRAGVSREGGPRVSGGTATARVGLGRPHLLVESQSSCALLHATRTGAAAEGSSGARISWRCHSKAGLGCRRPPATTALGGLGLG